MFLDLTCYATGARNKYKCQPKGPVTSDVNLKPVNIPPPNFYKPSECIPQPHLNSRQIGTPKQVALSSGF